MPKELVIRVPASIKTGKIPPLIDALITDLNLIVTLRGTLKSFPSSTHWHLKRDRGRGTLELTWWPDRRRLWIKIQAGRTAPWIGAAAPRLKQEIQSRFIALARSR